MVGVGWCVRCCVVMVCRWSVCDELGMIEC